MTYELIVRRRGSLLPVALRETITDEQLNDIRLVLNKGEELLVVEPDPPRLTGIEQYQAESR